MKILFAAADRDLLECYQKLLEDDLGQTVTAFDGTQVLALLSTERFDVLILDRKIPRVDHKKIIERARGKNIPVIVLTDEHAREHMRKEQSMPNSMLSYPFTFAEIKKAIFDMLKTIRNKERTEIDSEYE